MDELEEFIINNLWKIISSKENKDNKLQKIVEEISSFLRIEKISLMGRDKNGFFVIIAQNGLSKNIVKETKVKEGDGIAGMAILEKRAIFIRKIDLTREGTDYNRHYKTDSFIIYPIEENGKIIGVLNLTDKKEDLNFTEKDLDAIKPIIERIKFVMKN